MADLKQIFIVKCLLEYNREVERQMKIVAQRLGIGVTNEAINSIAYSAIAQGGGAMSKLSFREYLRMVDMGVGRGHPLGGMKAMRTTLQASKQQGYKNVNRGRKAKKVYSKIAYGTLTWLENKLLYGYTEETIEALKNELN